MWTMSAYFALFCSAAASAAPHSALMWLVCKSFARVFTTVTSHVRLRPLSQRTRVKPSGGFPSALSKPFGYFMAVTLARLGALHCGGWSDGYGWNDLCFICVAVRECLMWWLLWHMDKGVPRQELVPCADWLRRGWPRLYDAQTACVDWKRIKLVAAVLDSRRQQPCSIRFACCIFPNMLDVAGHLGSMQSCRSCASCRSRLRARRR